MLLDVWEGHYTLQLSGLVSNIAARAYEMVLNEPTGTDTGWPSYSVFRLKRKKHILCHSYLFDVVYAENFGKPFDAFVLLSGLPGSRCNTIYI